jgi:hypothetical protein
LISTLDPAVPAFVRCYLGELMMQRFGDRARFCVEIGEITSPSLRTVDFWAGSKWLTTDDNMAYVPSLCYYLRSTAARVRHRDVSPVPFPECSPEKIFRLLYAAAGEPHLPERFWLLHWGETVDNAKSYVFLDGDDLVIVFGYWRATHPFPEDLGKVFVARISSDEFVAVLEQATDLLDAGVVRGIPDRSLPVDVSAPPRPQ